MIADSLPYWPIDPMLTSSPWFTFQLDMARCLWAILPPALLWGASFPLALAAVAGPRQGSRPKVVGGSLRRQYTGRDRGRAGGQPDSGALDRHAGFAASAAGGFGAGRVVAAGAVSCANIAAGGGCRDAGGLAGRRGLLVCSIDPVPGELIAYGRRMAINIGQSKMLYTAEGRNSSVAITQWTNGAIEIDVNGHVEATTEMYDMKLQRMVGHLPALLHPNPKSVLGIGFGAGVSAGTFTRYPGDRAHHRVRNRAGDSADIHALLRPPELRGIHNPKTHIVFDDARHYVMTTTDKYDIIASDPLDVFVKGTAALYSKEYFDAVKAHLNPGGYFSLYVPLYESDLRTVKSELATFFESFPNATVWANTRNGEGYDMVFMGQVEPLKINVDEVQQRFDRPDYAPVVESLREVGVPSIVALFATLHGREGRPWSVVRRVRHQPR